MKKSKFAGIILMIVIVFQSVFFFGNSQFFICTFAVGLKTEHIDIPNVIYIFALLSAIFFLYFYFSESIYGLTHGYGKMYIIRKYSRARLMLKETGKVLISLICIVLFQTVLAFLLKGNLKALQAPDIIASVCAYLLGVFVCVLIQMHLEYYIEPMPAVIALCVFTFLSYYAAKFIPDNFLIKLIFFPSLMFGEMNGAVENIGQYIASICFLAALSVCLIFANIYKFKKSDIF